MGKAGKRVKQVNRQAVCCVPVIENQIVYAVVDRWDESECGKVAFALRRLATTGRDTTGRDTTGRDTTGGGRSTGCQ